MGGDASRRAGEAGGGERKCKPGSCEPGARAGGTAGSPRHSEAPRTHPSQGCPGPGRAGCGYRLPLDLRSSRLASRWLPPSNPVPRFPARPGLHVSSPSSQRHCLHASSASARRAPHTEPQHCLPLNSLHATWPSRRLLGGWAEPVPGLLGSSGKGRLLRASVLLFWKMGCRDPCPRGVWEIHCDYCAKNQDA